MTKKKVICSILTVVCIACFFTIVILESYFMENIAAKEACIILLVISIICYGIVLWWNEFARH